MKYHLTVETDDADEVRSILDSLSGSVTVITPPAPVTVITPPAPFVAAAPTVIEPVVAPAPPVVAPAPPIVAAAPNAEVDSSGLVWDERIHAKTKATVADGTWRKKRGIDATTLAAVEAELRAATSPVIEQPAQAQTPEQVFGTAGGVAAAPQTAPPVAPAPVVLAADDAGPMPEFLVRTAPPAPPVAAVAAVAPAPVTMTFQELMVSIGVGLREKKIDNSFISAVVAKYELPAITSLANTHAAYMPQIVAEFQAVGVVT